MILLLVPIKTEAAHIYVYSDINPTFASVQMLRILANVNWVRYFSIVVNFFKPQNNNNVKKKLSEPEFIIPIRDEIENDMDPDYDDSNIGSDSNDSAGLNHKAKIVIIATGVLGGLLLIVVAAILCKYFWEIFIKIRGLNSFCF